MEIGEQLSRQRVRHIISSYRLDGDDVKFDGYLEELLHTYPPALIELALAETLVEHWLVIPLMRGSAFLTETHQKLQNWESQAIATTLTPEEFHQITGLSPIPVFGASSSSPTSSSAYPV